MTWKSLPRATPGVLLRHPALLAEWLQLVNRWRRWRADSSTLLIVATLAAILLALSVLAGLSRPIAGGIIGLAEYWLLTSVITAVYAATSIAKRRRQARNSHLQSWLSAAPVALSSVRLSHAIRVITPTAAQFCAVAAFILFAQLLADGVTAAGGTVIACIGGGLILGGAVGWFSKDSRANSRWENSRYVARTNVKIALQPDGAALAGWSVAQVRAWSRPENSRYVLVAALFAVQGGSSAVAGLSVVGLYFLAGYLAGLLSALLKVANSAARWLRSTPMTLREFIWTLSRRALIHEVLGTALAAAFMLVLGVSTSTMLQVAASWLVVVMLVAGLALIGSYRGQSSAMKIALSLATMALVAACWQLRAGAKA